MAAAYRRLDALKERWRRPVGAGEYVEFRRVAEPVAPRPQPARRRAVS